MALINQAKREINAKIVYFGPGLSGKATNLKFIYGKLKPEFRGNLKAMDVEGGKMLFFDFTPPGDGNVLGYRVRLHVYTISGKEVDPASWKVVLKGVDGIAFVADAANAQVAANCRSLEQLTDSLKQYGLRLSSKPVVLQYNKTDQADALSREEMDRLLNPSALPSFMASSKDGTGVLQTLLGLVKAVLLDLRNKGVDRLTDMEKLQTVIEEPATSAAPPPRSAAPAAPAAPRPLIVEAPQAAPAAAPELPAEPAASAVPLTAAAPFLEPQVEEPLTVELSDAVHVVGPGRFSLPLTIRSGAQTKTVNLSLSLSLEDR